MTAVDDPILYVNSDTMDRLIASERATISSHNGVAKVVFPETDPRYPGATLLLSREVSGHAVHRRVWVPVEQRFIFEYVGDA